MPVFEYRCGVCGKVYRTLVGMTATDSPTHCPHCGGEGTRRVSRFKRGRSEDDRLDEMADRLEASGEPEGHAAMRETVRELGKAMDEDVSDELEELLEDDLSGTSDDEVV